MARRQLAENPARIGAHGPWTRGLHADTCHLLYRLGLRAGQLCNASLQESGLRLRHYALLRFLATSKCALQHELSARLGYDPSAIVGLIDDPEQLGFVEHRPAPDDRRSRIVAATEDGRAFLRATDEAVLQATNELLGPLEPAERETVQALLLRITEAGLT
ncbi:MarR family winged helix-turn-helix transcriptional regulator [Streptomyces pinistramenti]|uniref:MarR family winged helix-turn-helix transcriptional regulator n=1 Tax=Streptomyces pinistramenti TaxID=2884812 RepID=UPI001D09309D|nr:MarR family transcriptional regulator [Streptomyces pinistramenti]MCB5908860.1 MarR family transcriptional regulator [Streptomyces pinistramenti]